MREGILKKFKQDLLQALGSFEEESGGRHNRRPEITAAMSAMSEYITLIENPLILLNSLESYIKIHLTGFFKSMVFRDEYQLKKRMMNIFLQPEYSLQSLSHALYHESELEKLSLYRLIAQLEERLKSVEREKGEEEAHCPTVSQAEFEELRTKIHHLEECEKQAQIKISELENEKWLKEREIIALRIKVETLSASLEKTESENQKLKEAQALSKAPMKNDEKLIKKSTSQLIYQNHSTESKTTPEETCVIF